MLCVKEYASIDSDRERKLYVYLDPHDSIYDDNGRRLCAVLSLTYGLHNLCIPGKELEKVFRFLTQPDGGDPYGETTVNNYAERHAANREQLYKVATLEHHQNSTHQNLYHLKNIKIHKYN